MTDCVTVLSINQWLVLQRVATGTSFWLATAAMSTSTRDWRFCPISGRLLTVDTEKGRAYCEETGYELRLSEVGQITVSTNSNMQDFWRKYGLEPLVKESKLGAEEQQMRTRATVDEPCPKCHHPQMEYYTMQLRSADEGQTVFYECPKCRYKYSQNT